MRIRRKTSLVAVVFAIMALTGTALAQGQVGEPAAAFSLNVHGGGTYALADGDGQARIMFVIGYG